MGKGGGDGGDSRPVSRCGISPPFPSQTCASSRGEQAAPPSPVCFLLLATLSSLSFKGWRAQSAVSLTCILCCLSGGDGGDESPSKKKGGWFGGDLSASKGSGSQDRSPSKSPSKRKKATFVPESDPFEPGSNYVA